MSDHPSDAPPPSAADPVSLADSVESMSDEALLQLLEESRIVIRPGGQVVIENLTAGLLDVAYTLDPDNPGVQCRVDARDEAAQGSDGEGAQGGDGEPSGEAP